MGKTEFSANAKTKLCFWGGALWDPTRSSNRYLLYRALDNTDYFIIYGPEITWQDKNYKSYRGTLPIENNALVEGIKEAGIALVLHSGEHLNEGVPTARIFEAVAASAVVISDRHPFIIEHFGDNVLYIDENSSAEEMFNQVNNHVKWIHEHPEAAIKKAKAAHQIFVEKFTLEQQLEQIATFYEQLTNNKNYNTKTTLN